MRARALYLRERNAQQKEKAANESWIAKCRQKELQAQQKLDSAERIEHFEREEMQERIADERRFQFDRDYNDLGPAW